MGRDEIMGALKKMKGGKAASMDGIMVEMLKNGGISITDWLLRIFNKFMECGVVPEDWKESVSSQYTKEKGTGEIVLITE